MHTRNTVIMAAVLVLLAGFVYFYEIRGRAEREEAERQADLLVEFEIEDVQRISVTTAEGTVVASKADGEWAILEPAAVTADGRAIDTLVDRMHAAKHEREIAESADDLAPFGLDEPMAAVTLGLSDGSEVSIAVGKDTPIGMNVYVSTGDSDNVFSATGALKNDFGKDFFDLRDKKVLDFEESSINGIELSGGGMLASLQLTPGGDGQWTATAPFTGRADDDTIDDLLSALHTAEVVDFVHDGPATDEQLQEYGLAEPQRTVVLRTVEGAAYTMLVGAEAEEPESYYAMRDGGNSIFVVDSDLIDDLPRDAIALRNKQVVDFPREQVQALELSGSAGPARVERRDSDWEITAPRTLDADASSVSRLLSALQDLRAEGFVDTMPADTDLTVTLELDGGDDDAATSIEIRVGGTLQIVPLSAAGDEEPEEIDAAYVTTSDDGTAYLVPLEDLEDLRIGLFDLREKTLVQFTQPDLTGIDISEGETTFRVEQTDDTWAQTAPQPQELEANAVSDLLWDLNYLRMEGVATEWNAGESPDLAAFGLQSPRLHVVAHAGETVAVDISIGSVVATAADEDEPGQRVYVMIGDQLAVYEVAVAVADAVEGLLEQLAR